MESIFTTLNAVALAGWSLILVIITLHSTTDSSLSTPFFDTLDENELKISHFTRPPIIDVIIFLEFICFIEVGRIATGQLKGNLVLGVVLHMIRMSCLLLVLPNGVAEDDLICTLVVYSWSLTEVGRYPMYLFPNSAKARYVRLVLPLFTFPLGAAAEAIGAYRVLTTLLSSGGDNILYWIKIGSLGMVVLINSLLGPSMAYPALLKKGLPVLLGKPEKKKTKKA